MFVAFPIGAIFLFVVAQLYPVSGLQAFCFSAIVLFATCRLTAVSSQWPASLASVQLAAIVLLAGAHSCMGSWPGGVLPRRAGHTVGLPSCAAGATLADPSCSRTHMCVRARAHTHTRRRASCV